MSFKRDTTTGIFIAGGIITVVLFLVDPLFAAIGVVFLIVFFMSSKIMGETTHLPDIIVRLGENAKAITLVNRGNDIAQEIHVTLVPLNIEFDVPSLAADAEYSFALPSMVSEVRVLVTYQNIAGKVHSRTYPLSIQNPGDDDLLKPTVPLFGWK
ncbi:MAG: hypothetical protein LUO82_01910 [Methanomicrobiales archaeon]|nr:hypothetical protein [Methanomicrobiales archaeon]